MNSNRKLKTTTSKKEPENELKKYKNARKEAAKALEEKKQIWSLAQGPASKLVADMTLKKDLGPAVIPARMKNPNTDWLQQARKQTPRQQASKLISKAGLLLDDQSEEEDISDVDAPSEPEQNKFRLEKLDAEDLDDDGLEEFRTEKKPEDQAEVGVKEIVSHSKQKPAQGATVNIPEIYFATPREQKPVAPRIGRQSIASDKKLKQRTSGTNSHGSATTVNSRERSSTSGPRGSVVRTSNLARHQSSYTGSGTDDDNWSNPDDEVNERDETATKEPRPIYEMAEINFQPNEAMLDLEELLDCLQMEGRVTERYKYKLINKYSLFLQALITFQERELEMIDSINTKWKIVDALADFVKSETEITDHVVVAEEKGENDDQEQGILDFSSKHDKRLEELETEDPDKQNTHTDSHGLSLEEMNVKTIRETLLTEKNRLEVQEDMKRIQVLEAKQLEFEKTLLTLHYSRMVKPIDLAREMKDGRRRVNDLENEISQMQQEMSQLQTDVSVEEKAIYDDEKNVEKIELEALTKQNEVQQNANKPVHLSKEADREAHKLEQLEDQISIKNMQFMDDFDEMRILQGKIDKFMSELNTLIRDENQMHRKRKNSLHETENLLAQMEALVSREQTLLERAAAMTDKLAYTTKLKKKLHDEFHQINNEASKAHRESQRFERLIRMSTEGYLNSKLAYDKMKSAFEATRPKTENNWEKLGRVFQKEISNLKAALNKKLGEASIKANVVERLQKELNGLYEGQISAGKKLQDLIRTTVRKRHEREQKSEQCIQLERQINKLLENKKMQDAILEDLLRAESDFKALTKQMNEDCHKAKLAKAAMITNLVNAREKLTESTDKQASLEKEIEVVGAEIKIMEQKLGEMYFVTINVVLSRDTERNSALRNRDKFRVHRNHKNELLLDIQTLRREMSKQKDEVVAIRREYVRNHNASCTTAIKVRERIEEICTFTENIKLYDKILLTGAAAVAIREQEKIKLVALHEETRKHLLIVRMNQPDEITIYNKIEYLRNFFYKTTQERLALERRLNDDDSPALVREINFDLIETKENEEVLQKRLERAEIELASRDALGLERALMDKQLDDNIALFIRHANYLKGAYSEDVKVLVSLRKTLATLSRRIDGMICETSIAIEQAGTAEKQWLSLKDKVDEAKAQFKLGLSPNEEIEREWEHLQWRKKMLNRSRKPKTEYLTGVKRLTGSQIVMERMRPKKKGYTSQLDDNKAFPNYVRTVVPQKPGPPKKVKYRTGIRQ